MDFCESGCGLLKEDCICNEREGSKSTLIDGLDAETLARRFHETYERLAPLYSYKTKKASRVDWEDVPHQNKKLMIATCRELLKEGI